MLTKTEWLARCTKRLEERGIDDGSAASIAEIVFENVEDSDEERLASSPEDAADEEFSCWGEQ